MKGQTDSWRARFAVLVFWTLLIAGSLAQQPRMGRISGHVGDSVGAAIKGASIFVHKHASTEDNLKVVAHTDINGDFALALPEGGTTFSLQSRASPQGYRPFPYCLEKQKKFSGS